MADRSKRQHRVSERRQLIIEIARARAESGGWASVTTRSLASAIGFTQPVLYGHFPGGKTDIMSAVALTGAAELAGIARSARGERRGREATIAIAHAYLDFAAEHPAVYEAMFSLPLTARFAQPDSATELTDAFAALSAVVTATPGADVETATEVFWGALHGLSLLERADRLRHGARAARIAELAARFGPAETT